MEKVSFKVAKAIKDAGYPQTVIPFGYNTNGVLCTNVHETKNQFEYIPAPTYLEVWLWLWREMKIFIETKIHFDSVKGYYVTAFIISDNVSKHIETSDPEEAIIASIEYLVENNLIK